MRARPIFILLLLSLTLALPTVPADTEQGATVGLNLGFIAPGLWDAYWLDHAGGGAALTLSWTNLPFPPADYDLHLYRGDALNDGVLLPGELIAQSSTRTFNAHAESLGVGLPGGRYVVAVVPFQTQAELYTLSAAGSLSFAAIAPGFIATCPPFPC